MKKKILIALGLISLVAVSIGGTVAYLYEETPEITSTVETSGNVHVEQFIMQRNEDVGHTNLKTDPAKEGDLIPAEEGKMMLPAVPLGEGAYTAEPNDLFYWGYYTGGNGGNGLFDDAKLKNVVDKFVFVKNTGTVPCYFRTVYAFELPEGMTFGDAGMGDDIGTNVNVGYKFEEHGYIEIDDTRYLLATMTYKNWNNAILGAGETARPSLLQLVLNHNLGNEDLAKFGDTYDVKVVTQATQAKGFDEYSDDGLTNANNALDTTFGAISAENHPWKDKTTE